jgi:hypothetical protein
MSDDNVQAFLKPEAIELIKGKDNLHEIMLFFQKALRE